MKNVFFFLLFVNCLTFCSCDNVKSKKEKTITLTLDDVPYFDTTGKQSIYKNISPYEVKGIDPPNEDDDEKYDKPYSSFDFITNAYNELGDLGYSRLGSIIEFSHSLQDTIWANKIYSILRKHSSNRYLGSRKNFLDSIKKVNQILSMPINHSDSALRVIELDTI